MFHCIVGISDEADGDCNLTEPLGSEGDHDLDVDSDDDEGDCNQRRLIVECWLDLIVDVHELNSDSYALDFHDAVLVDVSFTNYQTHCIRLIA